MQQFLLNCASMPQAYMHVSACLPWQQLKKGVRLRGGGGSYKGRLSACQSSASIQLV